MAVSTIPMEIHELKFVYTSLIPSGTINAHNGAGATLTPTAPDGYKFLTHIAVWNTGAVGIIVGFDVQGNMSESINVYQNNTTNSAIGRGKINLLSLYYR